MAPLATLLRENWRLKLLSLVFAVGLWGFVASEERGDELHTIPLDLTDVPPGLEVTMIGTETVDVRVEGRRSLLARLGDRDLEARVLLKDARPGEMVVKVLPEHVSAPRGVQVVRVTPSRVRLTLESVTRGWVAVAPKVVGRPAPGYRVARVDVEPRRVEVRVAAADATLPSAVETAPVDIEGARAPIRREVVLAAPRDVRFTGASPRAEVSVEVVPQ